MFRFPKLLIAIAFAGTSMIPAQAQDRTAWVGPHVYGEQNPTDQAEIVQFNIDQGLGVLRNCSETDPAMIAFVSKTDVKTNNMIGFLRADRVTHYKNDPTGTLLVASGRGIDRDLMSGIYLGPQRNGMSVETAQTKLLVIKSHDAADMYLRLLLYYALIKVALDSGMDFRSVIGPLRGCALGVVHQAKPAEPEIVARIQYELIALQSMAP